MASKVCKRCGAEKPQSDFYAGDNTCKLCRCALVRANRASKVEQYRDYDKSRNMNPERVENRRKWIQSDNGKASKARTGERYKIENPEKRKAHHAINNAVRDGKLSKPSTCEHCNKTGSRIEGHHDDYSKPLQVTWLCSLCHRRHHAAHPEIED